MKERKPRLVLNMDVLARTQRNDAFQACDVLFGELARSDAFDVEFAASPPCTQLADEYLRRRGIAGQVVAPRNRQGSETLMVLQPADSEPELFRDDPFVIRAQVVGASLALALETLSDASQAASASDDLAHTLARLDARAVIIVSAPQVKDTLLRWRSDLSPAQFSVIPSMDALAHDVGRSAALLTEALLDADRRFRARPVSMLRQYPGEALADTAAPASFLGFRNGDAGPTFGMLPQTSCPQPPRPVWTDALPASGALDRPEGGLRTTGHVKRSTAALPLVSYITVVRNNVATLGRAIESVQRQTYANVEHIVLDGASTDGTLDLILCHGGHLDYFVSEPDRGLYDAINKAVPLARGVLICILNSDDWLEPCAAEIAVRRMRDRLEGAALLATGAVIYSLTGEVEVEWPPMFVHPGSYFACANVCHNGVYATRTAYERGGLYDTTFRIAADFKWIMACLDANVDFVYTREVTVNYSLGGTSGDARGHSLECQRVVAERFPFLSRQEVNGLYDSYFLFGRQPHDASEQPQGQATALLRRLFVEQLRQPDFQSALIWAAMTKLEHPADRPQVPAAAVAQQDATAFPSVRRSAKDLVKSLLYRHPALYRTALRSRGWLRR